MARSHTTGSFLSTMIQLRPITKQLLKVFQNPHDLILLEYALSVKTASEGWPADANTALLLSPVKV